MEQIPNREFLMKLAHYKMPFGKYEGRFLTDIPETYYFWFQRKGFPKGKLGTYMEAMLDIKINGLETLIRKIQKEFPMDSP